MPLYDGVISMKDGELGVIVAIEDNRVRLSAGGMEIGEWDIDDCLIQRIEDGVFSITAENETLRFQPNEPFLFQRVAVVEESNHETAGPSQTRLGSGIVAPAEGFATKVVIIAAAVVAGVMGIWALISLF